ncbi:M1 family metallopeptidase [Catenulispora sp. EB89]|uniref:M1 family metallopeptidase n=1 Tax=Catenulispora sp. EB89 TaxID=3156257 RepID=UPI0035116053
MSGDLVAGTGSGSGAAAGTGARARADAGARSAAAAPYFPRRGNEGYVVEHYELTLDYRVGSNRLTGVAVVTVWATASLSSLVFDFAELRVDRVILQDGRRLRFEHRKEKLKVVLPAPVAAGEQVVVEVVYRGAPRPTSSRYGGLGWEQLADGVLVASQPTGAPSWFPCNDRPDDKATYRIQVTTASQYRVVANGRLAGVAHSGSSSTWTFVQDVPMATYLATVQIGQYQRADLPGTAGGVPLLVVAPARRMAAAVEALAAQDAMIALFGRLFGPYPFGAYTVVVTEDRLEIPVEAQGVSMFGSNHMEGDGDGDGERLIPHELAHQWFGNSLTLGDWRDIWLHEGFACYAEWLWSEGSGGRSAAEHARMWHGRLARLPQDLVLADPGPADLFDDRVYKRGALTLHALRVTVGDEAFFGALREWTARFRHSTVSTAEFVEVVSSVVGRDLSEFFDGWLYVGALPALPR